MALASYADLKTSIAGWLNRRDLTAVIPDFIRLAEDDIASKLRDRRMLSRVEATVEEQPIALPTDWIEAARVAPEGGAPLEPVTLERLQELRHDRRLPLMLNAEATTGGPQYFAINGTVMEFWPVPASPVVLEMTYYARVPRLTDAAPTNWLLEQDAAVYLYGALVQSAPYLKDDQRVVVWAGLYKDRIDTRNNASRSAAFNGGALKRVRRGF
jgi:hypothetical protein